MCRECTIVLYGQKDLSEVPFLFTLSKSKSVQTTSIDVAEVGVILVGGREILEMWKEASMSLSRDCMSLIDIEVSKNTYSTVIIGNFF